MSDLILFWHRRDLRLRDHLGLANARQQSAKIVGVFCLDPGLLNPATVAHARVAYLLANLAELQERYRQAGSRLLILHDRPISALPRLAQSLKAQAVHWARDVEPYSRDRDTAVRDALQTAGIEVKTGWDQLLHAPNSVTTNSGDPYKVYTPFWRNWRSHPKAEPAAALSDLEDLTADERDTAAQAGVTALPDLRDLGFAWDDGFPIAPGEAAAQERLDHFCQRAIAHYDEQRNFPALDGTSQLSAALKFGVIGIRTVWQAAQSLYAQANSDEARQNIETWQQELAWREFYQHALYAFPELATGPYRQPFQDFPWDDDAARFEAWCTGQTGYPIVDAAMRQLNETGWMHNRCRMIVASFLTKDLILNWQQGEQYFMFKLVDGDLAANNGGWQWSASSGMDPKPLRIFNPASQARKYDPDGDYIRHWLPELRSLDTGVLLTGEIDAGDRQACNYPEPIVNHKQQQQEFKRRYQAQKERD
ncbi:MAG: deoxyribodipyrimidine photolyase [Spirulinaceae cyanobacterium SM2_1_0]|nr:deoxyribodipyrimidine photolyase [Spirulinaceae cyanobacterium SM2_1_0]